MVKRSRSCSALFGELDGEETPAKQEEPAAAGLGGDNSKKKGPLAGEAKRHGKASAPENTPAKQEEPAAGGLGGDSSKGKERPLAGEAKRHGKSAAPPEKTPAISSATATPCPSKKQSLRELAQLMPGPAMVGESSLIQQAANYVQHLKDPSSTKLQRPDGMRRQDVSSATKADAYAALQAAVPGSAYLKPGWLLPYTIQYITEHLTAEKADEEKAPAAEEEKASSSAAPPRDKEEAKAPPAASNAAPARDKEEEKAPLAASNAAAPPRDKEEDEPRPRPRPRRRTVD